MALALFDFGAEQGGQLENHPVSRFFSLLSNQKSSDKTIQVWAVEALGSPSGEPSKRVVIQDCGEC